jgi:glycerate-2-kinase
MGLIKNYPELASNDSRKIVLNLIEAGLSAIQFDSVMQKSFSVQGSTLQVQDKTYNLKDFDRIFLIAFGKGSGAVSKIIETSLGGLLTKGFAIDASETRLDKVEFTLGTHPLPSNENIEFSKKVVEEMHDLTEKDLVLVVICGGGSVLFEVPHRVSLEKLIEVNKALLSSGADIFEMNTIRKHLSQTKGGGLVKILQPAKVVSLIFSDVPGNDLSFIASGPTVKDETAIKDALEIYQKYNLTDLDLTSEDFTETPKEDGVFDRADNILMLSNLNALNAMKEEAEKWGITAEIYSDKFQSNSEDAGRELIDKTKPDSILLVGGETTVKVKNKDGQGGRNHHLVLSSLDFLGENTLIASVDSDGWDNTPAAGAIGDADTIKKYKEQGLDKNKFLEESNSYLFFKNINDAIITNRLPSNVADLIIVYKH